MTVSNNLKRQVDIPVWEWNRFAPAVTAAGFATCVDESSGGRFIYYLTTTQFWRYDTVTDSWQQLQAPQTVALTATSLRYSTYGGLRGRVLAASSTSITIPAIAMYKCIGKTIRITEGTGAGQERVVSACGGETIVESGMASTAGANSITDNQTIPKKWRINEWRGYSCRVVFGSGHSQTRKILYNDTNTLYFFHNDYQAFDSWSNTPFAPVASGVPYIVPAASSHYYITKEVETVSVQWDTIPDATSKFMMKTGAVWACSGRTLANGAASMQYYSVAEDVWYQKTSPGGMMGYLLTGDVSIERCGEIGGTMDSGDCDASAARTMVDATKTWTVDQWVGFSIITTKTSTGVKYRSTILGNSATTLYTDDTWEATPDTSFTYIIQGNANNIWLAGNNYATLYKYLVEQDQWTDGWHYDEGVCNNLSARFGKQKPFHYVGTAIAAGVLTVHASPTAPGAGYKVGDIVNVTTGGVGCKVRVTGIDASGGVTGVELYCAGISGTHTTGTGKATTLAIPAAGGNNALTVNVLTVGSTAQITTTTPHNLKAGDSVTLAGASVSGWNAAFTITCADTTTTFNIIPPNTTAPSASASNAAGTLVDTTKNWTPGEFIGKRCIIYTSGPIPTSQIGRISANTATTLTLAVGTPVAATSRYVIADQKCFGGDKQQRNPAEDSIGWVTTGGSTTVITDATKAWVPHQWVGYKLRVICGTGFDKGEIAITASTATTLTTAALGFTTDTSTKYEIMDSFGVATGTFGTVATIIDSTKNWAVNQWAGKMIRFNAGVNQTVEVLIASNTATVITCGAITIPTATTMYSILGIPVRQIGIQLMWNFGQTYNKGKYLYCSRGGTTTVLGTNTIDVYDITKNRWDFCMAMAPQSELLTIATQWCYDNKDRIYFSNAAVSSSRIGYIDLITLEVIPSGQTPYAHGAGVQGNRMDIVETVDGLKYLYLMRQTGAEYWRTLIFW